MIAALCRPRLLSLRQRSLMFLQLHLCKLLSRVVMCMVWMTSLCCHCVIVVFAWSIHLWSNLILSPDTRIIPRLQDTLHGVRGGIGPTTQEDRKTGQTDREDDEHVRQTKWRRTRYHLPQCSKYMIP